MSAVRRSRSRQKTEQTYQTYRLDDQVGFLLRQVNQRHSAIFVNRMGRRLTTTQFVALVKLYEVGRCSQNRLGRLTAMDGANIKAVIQRLSRRGFTKVGRDFRDTRLLIVSLTRKGLTEVRSAIPKAIQITKDTLKPLGRKERANLLILLRRLC